MWIRIQQKQLREYQQGVVRLQTYPNPQSVGDNFTYEYNIFDSLLCDIQIERIEKDLDDKPNITIGCGNDWAE